ncbi:MAG: Holliday junction resolvase RuvX, partial [Acidobacteria bacterium]|nr:Holliday junction resolvase RuvX [Acidobacteriota bacterium]
MQRFVDTLHRHRRLVAAIFTVYDEKDNCGQGFGGLSWLHNRGEMRMRGRVLAIDFGMKRMGLAVSDALGLTAQGLPTLERRGREDDVRRIAELVEEYSAACVLLGNPLGSGGQETEMSRRVAAFAE